MLYFDTALELKGVTLYRDYNDPHRYWYLPGSPRVAHEGNDPLFQLLIYRRDITDNPDFHAGDRPGGGFLTMTVDLGVSKSVLDAIKAELSSRVGTDVDLVPVLFNQGNVRVTALGVSAGTAPSLEASGADASGGTPAPPAPTQGPRFVENILGSSRPSLYGDNRAVFSLELSQEGAVLMRASLEDGGASQVAVIYDLELTGLMPAFDVKITIDFRQTYDYLRNRFQLNTLFFRADIDSEYEQLVKQGAIKIETVDYVVLEPQQQLERQERLTNLAKDLATWSFFRPGLQPGRVLAADRGELTVYDATRDATANQAGFTQPLPGSGGATVPSSQAAIQAAGSGVGAPGNVAGPRIQGIAPPPEGTPGATQPGATQPGATQPGGQGTQPGGQTQPQGDRPLTAVEAWNRAGRPQAAYLLKQLHQEELQTITFNMTQVSAVKRNIAPQGSIRVAAGDARLAGRIKQVDLDDPFFDEIHGSVTSGADLAAAGVRSMTVKVRYGEEADGTRPKDSGEWVIARTGDKSEFTWTVDHRFSLDLEYQVVVHYVDGYALGDQRPDVESPWVRTSTRNLDLDPADFGGLFDVNVTAAQVDWTVVKGLQVEVEYAGQTRSFALSAQKSAEKVPIRPLDGSSAYKVRSHWFYEQGDEVVEIELAGERTVILNQPPSRLVPINITSRDPLGRYRKVDVELSYTPADGSPEQTRLVELTGDAAAGQWTLFRADPAASAKYRYRITYFRNDGGTLVGDWQQTTERQLIVGDVFPGMLDVEVRFVGGMGGDLAASGFAGVRLSLEYPDAPAGVDNRDQFFLSGMPQPLRWRVPMARRDAHAYHYQAEYIRNDGTRTVQEGTISDEVLVLFIPAQGG